MRGLLKNKLVIVILSALIFTNCFGKEEVKATNKASEESTGFYLILDSLKSCQI